MLSAVCSHLLTLVPRSRIFLPWRWRRYIPPKRRFTQDLHDATSQKTAFFIVTAVKTSNQMDIERSDIFRFCACRWKWMRVILNHIKWMPRPTSSSSPPSPIIASSRGPTRAQIAGPIHYSSSGSTQHAKHSPERTRKAGRSLVTAPRSCFRSPHGWS
jgi:hypothetical protein